MDRFITVGVFMGLSNAVRSNAIKAIFNKEALLQYSTIYLGLSTLPPTDDGNNIVEPVGGNYLRQAVANADLLFSLNNDQAILTLNSDIIFPTASANWASSIALAYVVIYSQVTGGAFIGWGQLYVPKVINNGDIFSIKAGKFVLGLL